MKKNPLFALLFAVIIFAACKKNDSSTPAAAVPFMTITPLSSWQYSLVNNRNSTTSNYSLTSTSRDTLINSRSYHVFTNSNGNSAEYYFRSGADYYNFRNLGATLGNTTIEALYLKDNTSVGGTWSQSTTIPTPIGFPIPVTLTFTCIEKGISKIVNGISYNDVIHIKTAITSTSIPAASLFTDIHNYYAPRVGAIESTNIIKLNFSGVADTTDTKTILLSSDIR